MIYVTSVASEEWTSQGVPKSILIQKPFAPSQIITAIAAAQSGDLRLYEVNRAVEIEQNAKTAELSC